MDKPEKLTTLGTQDTWRRQTKQINVRENRRGNQEWTNQRNWQHWVHKTQYEDKPNKKQKQNNTTHYVLDTTLHKQLEVKTNWTSFNVEIVNGHHDHDYTSPCISNRQNWRSEIRKFMWKYIHIIGFCYSAPLRRTILFKIINVFHILKQGICFMCFFNWNKRKISLSG